MAASELFNRYIWLVDLIFSSGGITREEISSRWSRSSLNYNNEPEIPERTFHRHKDAIKELFDIDIVCDRSAGKVYKIANSDDIRKGGVRTWLINTFAVNNLINESHQIKQRILFEQIPSGQRFLTPIIEAMRDNHTLTVTYQSFIEIDLQLLRWNLIVSRYSNSDGIFLREVHITEIFVFMGLIESFLLNRTIIHSTSQKDLMLRVTLMM